MFSDTYSSLLKKLLNNPDHETAPRGMAIKEIMDEKITLDYPENCMASWDRVREFPHDYLLAEFAFYLSGVRSSSEIGEAASLWNDIQDLNRINSNYGRLVFHRDDHLIDGQHVSAFFYVFNQLTKDNDTRRAVLKYLRPEHLNTDSDDVVCTISSQFFIRDNKLNQFVNMRSSDAVFGLTFDLPWHSFVQQQLLQKLNDFRSDDLEMGKLHLRANSLHLYERHFEMAEGLVNSDEEDVTNHMLVSNFQITDSSGIIKRNIHSSALDSLVGVDFSSGCDRSFVNNALDDVCGVQVEW